MAGLAPSKYRAGTFFVSSYFLGTIFLLVMPWYGLSDVAAYGSTHLFDQGTARTWSW
jgi:hypothetical protein